MLIDDHATEWRASSRSDWISIQFAQSTAIKSRPIVYTQGSPVASFAPIVVYEGGWIVIRGPSWSRTTINSCMMSVNWERPTSADNSAWQRNNWCILKQT